MVTFISNFRTFVLNYSNANSQKHVSRPIYFIKIRFYESFSCGEKGTVQ